MRRHFTKKYFDKKFSHIVLSVILSDLAIEPDGHASPFESAKTLGQRPSTGPSLR